MKSADDPAARPSGAVRDTDDGGMIKPRVRKVLIYCIADDRLLVFRHVDFPSEEVGLQVPGGSVRPDETEAQAALRELREETGRDEFEIVRLLGRTDYDISPYRSEIQDRAFFQAIPTTPLPQRWTSAEAHDGRAPATLLEFFWIPLRHAHVLQAGQGERIAALFDRPHAVDD